MSITVTNSVSGTPAAVSNGFAGGTVTFSNLNGGTNFSSGTTVVVMVNFDDSGPPGSPKIGGQTPTGSIDCSGAAARTATMFYLDVTSSIADTFACSGSGYDKMAVIAWVLSGAATGGPSSSVTITYPSAGNPQTFPSITNPSGGVIIAGGAMGISGGQTPAWTNCTSATGDMTTSYTTTLQVMGAHSTNSGATTITNNTTGAPFGFGGIAAAWAPSGGGSPKWAPYLSDDISALQVVPRAVGY